MGISQVMSPFVRGGRESRLALSLVLASAALLGASLAGAQSPAALKSQQGVLAGRSHSALLGLFSLDARLTQARSELARIHSRVGSLRSERLEAQRQLALVSDNVRLSQRMLAAHLRMLYEQGEPDAIAILLGSSSLDDAITRLNDLEQTASQGASAVADTENGRVKLTRLAATLAAQLREAQALEARAARTAAALERARAQRVAYLASLARQRQMTTRQISTLDTRARRVVKQAQTVQSRTASRAPEPASRGSTITVTVTGYSLGGTTATGLPVGPGVVAVDPSVIPLGTRMTIPGYGEGVAADTGSAVSGYTIDVWFPSLADALAWGRRTVEITLH